MLGATWGQSSVCSQGCCCPACPSWLVDDGDTRVASLAFRPAKTIALSVTKWSGWAICWPPEIVGGMAAMLADALPPSSISHIYIYVSLGILTAPTRLVHLASTCRVVRTRARTFTFWTTVLYGHERSCACTQCTRHHARSPSAVLGSTGDDDLPTGAVTPAAVMDIIIADVHRHFLSRWIHPLTNKTPARGRPPFLHPNNLTAHRKRTAGVPVPRQKVQFHQPTRPPAQAPRFPFPGDKGHLPPYLQQPAVSVSARRPRTVAAQTKYDFIVSSVPLSWRNEDSFSPSPGIDAKPAAPAL